MFNCVLSNTDTRTHTQEVVGVNGFWFEESNTVLTLKGPITHNPITTELMDRFWTRMGDLAHLRRMRVFVTIFFILFNCHSFRLREANLSQISV